MTNREITERLELPVGKLHMVLDTDTYNEVDDQFALAYALLSKDRLIVDAVYAAPFHNNRSSGAEDGMEKSYNEILRLLGKMKIPSDGLVFKGARQFMGPDKQPVDSPAVQDLIAKAMAAPVGEPLYVAAIGAITNVASAVLLEPKIIEKIVVVWLGGNALHWPTAREFNLSQDIYSVQVLLDSTVPFVLVPCMNVTSHLTTSVPELKEHIDGKNPLCEALVQLFGEYTDDHFAWGKEIWDVSVIAYLINPDWVPTVLEPSPILTSEHTWSRDPNRHPIKVAQHVQRNPIFADMFRRLCEA